MNKKRIEWIDVAKGIGMLLVIFGHFGMDPTGKYLISYVKSSFHMPLFFVASGIVFREGSSFKECLGWAVRRFVTVMIPYYLWTAIYSNGSYKGFAGILYASNRSLSAAGSNAAMWFIPCICVAGIILKFELWLINILEVNSYVKHMAVAVADFVVGGYFQRI